MKNNKQNTRKVAHRTKDEKRRLTFEKRNVKKEKNLVRYGAEGGSALVMAKTADFNSRFIAAFLALVFVLTSIVVGYNFAVKADDPNDGFKMLSETDDKGFVTRKGIRYNENTGKYDLRMEAYATAPIATKAIDTKTTPLDVVMVLNQSESMGTPDIWNGNYEEAAGTFSIENAIGKYYKVGDQYYPVQYDVNGYAKVQDNNGQEIKSWTASSVQNWLNNNTSKLLYLNASGDERVISTTGNKYSTRTNEIDMGASYMDHDWFTNHHFALDFYVYVPHDAADPDGAGDSSCWHRVYYREDGYTLDGYYYTFYYYTNSETGSGASFSDGKAGDVKGSGASQVTLLCDYHACATAGATVLGVRVYVEKNGYIKYWRNTSGNAGTDGKLYTKASSSTGSKKMVTIGSNGNVVQTLACQMPDSDDSHLYNSALYTEGLQLYYQTDPNDPSTKHYIGNSVFKTNNDIAYNSETDGGPLYTREYITRTKAIQQAASQLAESIATQATTNNVEHRIGVVGYNSTGSVLTSPGLVVANANDTSDEGTVNDIVDTAINDLTATGSRKLDAGLSSAATIFHDNLYEDGWDGKRIVVVFSDEIPDNSTDEVWNAGAVLKDTYNAAVYTVGLWDEATGTSANFNDYLNLLSSNQFRSTSDGDNTPKGDTNTEYYYNSEKKLDTLISKFNSNFNSIATSLATPYTSVALDEDNSVLRDIISDNFIVPANPTVTLQTASSSYANDNFSWTIDQSISTDIASNWDAQNRTLSVTGFGYNSNYVTTEQSGKKIIVTIEGLTLKGNAQAESDRRIYSNEAGSGIYKSKVEDLLFAAFPRPYVDKTSNLVPKGTSGEPGEGVVVNKYLTANENGNYDLTMEAYATSMTEAVTTVEKIPTDFVLVVDQSGSMDTRDMPVGNPTVQNNKNLEEIATGNYYYKDGDQYYRVYGVRDYLYRYYPANHFYTGTLKDYIGANLSWFMRENEINSIDNALYFRETINGKNYYNPLKITIQGVALTYLTRFQYTSKITGGIVKFNRDDTTYSTNGKSPWYHNVMNGDVMTSGALWSAANWFVQTGWPDNDTYTFSEVNLGLAHPKTGMYINYPMYSRHLGYTKLCYRDVNGVEHEVPSNYNNQTTWEYCDDDGNARSAQAANSARPTYSGLYKFPQNIDRLTALKAALNEFAQAVAQETDDFGKVDNKVSIVGFSSTSSSTTHDPDSHINYNYNNTELLTHTQRDVSNSNGWQKSTCDSNASEYYAKALVDSASEGQGENAVVNPKITQAINALTHNGGTQPEDGLNMAYQVLTNRSNTTYEIRSGDHTGDTIERNTVVIFFTDGQPGNYHESNQYSEANEVVQEAKRIKDYNDTSLFSIGVFGESDGNPLTYSANNDWTTGTDGNRTQVKNLPKAQWKYLGGWMETYDDEYCLRRQWRPGNANYTETANDTIYDYMSVTSSNYPDAENFIDPRWLNGTFPNDSYVDATDGVDGNTVRHKSSAEATNKYYRMASSQDTLVEAFLQAITMTNHQIESDGTLGASTILRDILENDTFEMTSSTNYTIETDKGTADPNGVVTFDNNKTTIDLGVPPSLGTDRIEVSGFDYNTNSIFYGKAKDDANGLAKNEGRKLIVTLTNVVPKKTITSSGSNDNLLYSNETESGLWKNKLRAAFPTPAITRHSYTLSVDGDNKAATFDVTTTLVAGPAASGDLSDVILVAPDGTRTPYNELDEVTFSNMADGQTFYFENVPPGYSVQTSLKAPDSFYTYTYWENNDASNPVTLSMTEPTESTLNYLDNVLHVNSVSSYKTVTIAESVSGEYANTNDVFSVNVTLTPLEGELYNEETIKIADDVTLNRELIGKSYKTTIDNLPGDQNEKELRIPAGWTLKVEPVKHDKYSIESGYPKYNTDESATKEVLPNSGVVISSNLTNIFINNIADDIPVTGINASGHNWIIYILAALGGLAAIGAGIFLWKKKDEFVEQ